MRCWMAKSAAVACCSVGLVLGLSGTALADAGLPLRVDELKDLVFGGLELFVIGVIVFVVAFGSLVLLRRWVPKSRWVQGLAKEPDSPEHAADRPDEPEE
jgi:hypothetical protein